MKSGNLNFLEPSGPLQACNGTDLPLPLVSIFIDQISQRNSIERLKNFVIFFFDLDETCCTIIPQDRWWALWKSRKPCFAWGCAFPPFFWGGGLFVWNSVWEIFTYCCSFWRISWKCARKTAHGITFTHWRVYLEQYYISKAQRAPVKSQLPPGGAGKNHEKN